MKQITAIIVTISKYNYYYFNFSKTGKEVIFPCFQQTLIIQAENWLISNCEQGSFAGQYVAFSILRMILFFPSLTSLYRKNGVKCCYLLLGIGKELTPWYRQLRNNYTDQTAQVLYKSLFTNWPPFIYQILKIIYSTIFSIEQH